MNWIAVLLAGFMFIAVGTVYISVGTKSAEAVVGEQSAIINSLGDLRTCLSQDGSILDVYYLIDNSRSMIQIGNGTGTDTEGLRFDAVDRSVKQFVDLVKEGTTVNVAAGVFSKESETIYPWTVLGDSSDDVIGEIGESLRRTPIGGGTNWQAGLELAKDEFIRQSENSALHCQALVWVTDGGIDVEGDPARTASSVLALCGIGPTEINAPAQPSGLMHQLRSMGIIVIGVLLDAPNSGGENLEDGPQAKRDSKISYLQPVVEGTGTVDTFYFEEENQQLGSFNCGTTVSGAAGAKLTIAQADDLANEFQRLVSCITDSCTELRPTPIVQCEMGTCEIPVPNGIQRLQVQVSEDFDTNTVKSPTGAVTCSIDGMCELTRGSDTALSILTVKTQNEGGYWSFDDSQNTVHPLLFADLKLESDPVTVNPRQPAITTEIRIVQGEGLTYESDNYSDQRMQARIHFPNGDQTEANTELIDGKWTVSWAAADELSPIPISITVEFTAKASSVITSDRPTIPSLQLAPVAQQFKVKKESLESFPTIINPEDGATAFFSPINGLNGQGQTTISFRGPEVNDGAVCWGNNNIGFTEPMPNPDTSTPEDQDKSRIVGQVFQTPDPKVVCPQGYEGIALLQGKDVELPIVMTQREQLDAVETGALNFILVGTEKEGSYLESVPFQVETTIVRNNSVRLAVLAALAILGFGLPYALLLLFVRRQAVFAADLDGSRWASLPAIVGPDGLESISELSPEKYEFIFMDKGKPARTITMGADTHEAVPPRLWPFRPIRTVVSGPKSKSIFSNHDPSITANRSAAVSSLVLSDVFYFVADTPEESAEQTSVITDEWGNKVADTTTRTERDAQKITGRLVVILTGYPDLQTSVSTTLGKARAWPDWSQIYAVQRSSATERKPMTVETVTSTVVEPEQTASTTPDSDFYFPSAESTSTPSNAEKKSRFSRRSKKDNPQSGDSGFSGMPPADDW